MLTFLPGFILKFLGGGIIQSALNHRKDMAEVAAKAGNDKERLKNEAAAKELDSEIRRREAVKELQIKEAEHPYLWWGKFLLIMAVSLYWAARFCARILGLDDFNVFVKELDAPEEYVSYLVLSYLFLDKTIRTIKGPAQ
jgi:hypothetical protein